MGVASGLEASAQLLTEGGRFEQLPAAAKIHYPRQEDDLVSVGHLETGATFLVNPEPPDMRLQRT